MKRIAPLAVLVAGALTMTACSNSQGEATGGDSLTVVTSTNVYADIVRGVAGDKATVTPIIDDPNKDPHSYEATSQDQLTLSEADLVVQNGGGYDAFITTMLEALDKEPHVIDTVAISGLPGSEGVSNEPHDHDHGEEGHDHEGEKASEEAHDHAHEGESSEEASNHDHEGEKVTEEAHDHDHGAFNEHVWYSVPTMVKLVDKVEGELSGLSPDNAETFKSNADKLRGELGTIVDDIENVHDSVKGKKSAATEPVPLWLFEDMGIENITPQEFLSAVEEGNDVSPTVLQDAKEQVDKKEVDILVYNTQATNEQAEVLKKSAEEAGIPVVDMSETMPEGKSYIEWMSGYVSEVQSALS